MPRRTTMLIARCSAAVLMLAASHQSAVAQREMAEFKMELAVEFLVEGGFRAGGESRYGVLSPGRSSNFGVQLEGGRHYVIVGVCDMECGDIDLSVLDSRRQVVARMVHISDEVFLEFVPATSGRYDVRVELNTCTVRQCHWGVTTLSKPVTGVWRRWDVLHRQIEGGRQMRGSIAHGRLPDNWTIPVTAGDTLSVQVVPNGTFLSRVTIIEVDRQGNERQLATDCACDRPSPTGVSSVSVVVPRTGKYVLRVDAGSLVGPVVHHEYDLTVRSANAARARTPRGATPRTVSVMDVAISPDGERTLAIVTVREGSQTIGHALLQSADRGASWVVRTFDAEDGDPSLITTNERIVVIAMKDGGGMLSSLDEGATWFRVGGRFGDITALAGGGASLLVLAVSHPDGQVYQSLNGGITWHRLLGTRTGSSALHMIGGTYPLSAGSGGIEISTDYLGRAWRPASHPATSTINALAGSDLPRVFVAVATNGEILRSIDGLNWSAVQGVNRAPLFSAYVSGDRAVVGGGRGTLLVSADTGKTWRAEPSGVSGDIRAMTGLGPVVIAGTSDGVLLRSTDGGATWSATPVLPLLPLVMAQEGLFRDRRTAEQLVAEAQTLHGAGNVTRRRGELLGRAAGLGNAEAQAAFGRILNLLNATDLEFAYYALAAEQGDPSMQLSLATAIYLRDEPGVPPMVEAAGWLKRSAASGNVKAMELLGAWYEEGHRDLQPDRAQSVDWYRRAAAAGSETARLALQRLVR